MTEPLLLFALLGCAPLAPNAAPSFESLWRDATTGTLARRRAALEAIHGEGLRSIDPLIERIASGNDLDRSLGHPMNSVPGPRWESYAGELAAYLIDLILARTELPLARERTGGFLLGSPQGAGLEDGNYLYRLGVINFRYGFGPSMTPTPQPVEPVDLPAVQDVYRRWWKDRRVWSLAALRADWKAGHSPLDGSIYVWS